VNFGGIKDLEDLSDFLGFSSQNLYYLVDISDGLYSAVKIPKKQPGKFRTIFIPVPELRGVQKQILRSILQQIPSHKNAVAYKRGLSVVDAAKKLCGPNYLLKMDVKDFFPSIAVERVFSLFKRIGFNNVVSHVLTKLTTYKGGLVQGAPTSPAISNLVCDGLDEVLTRLADSWSMRYMRYSDDMFFFKDKGFKHRHFSLRVSRILKGAGFRTNRGKTRYYQAGQPRHTLGLLTHGRKVALPRKTRKNYRAAFYKASKDVAWARKNQDVLAGMSEWYRAIYGKDDRFLEYSAVLKNIKSLRIHSPYLI